MMTLKNVPVAEKWHKQEYNTLQHIGIVEQQKVGGKGRDDSIKQFSIQPSAYYTVVM